jgi:outer membrane protein TolC
MKNFLIKIFFMSLLFILCKDNLFAQADSTDIVLTLDKAVSIALQKNYDIRLAELSVLKADEQITEAYAGAWPKINLNGHYTRNLKSPVLFIPPNTPFNPSPNTLTFSIGAKNSYDLGISLSQTLYDPRLGTAISIAKKYSQYSDLSNESTKDDVIAQVKESFYSVLLSKKLVDVNEQGYKVAQANYENTGALYKQGVASEYDYLRAEVQLANVKPSLIEAKNNLQLAMNALKNLLSLDLNTTIEVEGEFKVEKVSQDLIERSNEILKEKNPTLQKLSLQKLMLEENVSIEQAAYLPTLSAFGNYAWQTQDNTFDFKNYNWANTITVGLQLSYPIFDGFKRSAKIQQAKIDVENLEVTRNKTEAGLKISLMQSKLKMEEALDRIHAQEKSVQQAQRALEIAQTRYKQGVGTQLEILDTQNSLRQTRINYEKAVYDFLISKTEWEKVLGIITK